MNRTKKKRVPKLVRHRPTGQGRVRLSGKDFYCGLFGTADCAARYASLVQAWENNGRKPLEEIPFAGQPVMTLERLCAAYLEQARVYYRNADGSPTGECNNMRLAVRRLENTYGHLPAAKMTLAHLKDVRQLMLEDDLARSTINATVSRIVRMVRWAAEEQLIPGHVFGDLRALRPLQRGRSCAREPEPKEPVRWEDVTATLPKLNPHLRALVLVLWFSGMRCGEAVQLRAREVDMTGNVWIFRPPRHKGAWRQRTRQIDLGPQAQEVLRPFVQLDPDRFWFRPCDAESERNGLRREERKTPLWPSHVQAQDGKRCQHPKRPPGEIYETRTIGHAIRKACARAGILPWSPHRLRHAALTRIRSKCGIQAAIAVGGHADARMTEHYTRESERKLAAQVMAELG